MAGFSERLLLTFLFFAAIAGGFGLLENRNLADPFQVWAVGYGFAVVFLALASVCLFFRILAAIWS